MDRETKRFPGAGVTLAPRQLRGIDGQIIPVPDPGRLIHLQFRRFSGCPVCNLHLRSLVRRRAEIERAGIREVVVFHAPADELCRHSDGFPFDFVADPDKRLYAEFGVESRLRALLDPRVWPTIVVAVVRSLLAILRGSERPPRLRPHGGRFGLPADFLIDGAGRVLASKRGQHADDQWSAGELLALARSRGARSTSALRSDATPAER